MPTRASAPAPHPRPADAASVGLSAGALARRFGPSALKKCPLVLTAGVRAGAVVEKCVRCVSRTAQKFDNSLKRKDKSPTHSIADPSAIRQHSGRMRQPSVSHPSAV